MTIADMLTRKGLLTTEQLAEAQSHTQAEGLRLDRAVVQKGWLTERQLLEVFGEQLHLPVVTLEDRAFDGELLRSLPARVVYRQRLVPVGRVDGLLQVATSDPFDLYAFDDLRLLTGLNIQPVLATREEIEKVIKTHYGLGGDTLDEMVGEDDAPAALVEGSEDLLEAAQEASVIKLVNEIILEAVNERASDIHVEPYEHHMAIRYRIDGVLQDAPVPPQMHRFAAAIISRIKILANLNIAERRIPQDGRIKFNVGGRQIDVRVSVIPMLFGEGVVMRLLDKANVLFTLPQLGMDAHSFELFKGLIDRPHGIFLVTGPTGAGKTTTLYAALNAIVGPGLKVLTVEDPVEYNLTGVNQIPVNAAVGMTFEKGLRAILRHDPDVVMIGEIRDLETASAAIQAALTGHLVLSTLHTNDAASAPMRLIDMGVEPFLISSTMIGSMAQRLVRRICSKCKADYEPDRAHLPRDLELAPGDKLWRGTGCPNCRNTGYRGRSGLYELMVMSDALSEKIIERAPQHQIVSVAKQGGLRLLREDGWDKVRQGITTPDEVVMCTAG
ncbi:MAG: type IV pilus assembly protein PilB [Limisphaerales bacterium]|nr:MAG: type IV pilus assembly protein PilB [Limisphaerales bacterium]KAG0509387.1 MAG: type IV pilus assembly protein PilB [Limisphaerales bacterium]TXT52132.1 MAG: type IV pilus assembly protein PilB [Limisphaerales bacterium]